MVAVFLDSPGGQHVPVKHREGENYLGKRRLIEQIIKKTLTVIKRIFDNLTQNRTFLLTLSQGTQIY